VGEVAVPKWAADYYQLQLSNSNVSLPLIHDYVFQWKHERSENLIQSKEAPNQGSYSYWSTRGRPHAQ
jgi:hypothetical protein